MMHLKKIAVTVLAATALSATLGAGSASATTLEIEGVTKNEAIFLQFKPQLGTSLVLKDTFGFSVNTCTESEMGGFTNSPYTGATVTAWLSFLEFRSCSDEVNVHLGGTLHIAHIAGTTNGTVSSSGAQFTTDSPFGTLLCQTGFGTHLGTLTGKKTGWSRLDLNATINCGISAKWVGSYETVHAQGLGVSA